MTVLYNGAREAVRHLWAAIVSAQENHPDVQIVSQVFGYARLQFVGAALREVDDVRCPAQPLGDSIAMNIHREDGSI